MGCYLSKAKHAALVSESSHEDAVGCENDIHGHRPDKPSVQLCGRLGHQAPAQSKVWMCCSERLAHRFLWNPPFGFLVWHQAGSTLPSRPRSIAKLPCEIRAGFLQSLVGTLSARECFLHSACQLSWQGDGALPSICDEGHNFWREKHGLLAQTAQLLSWNNTHGSGLTREPISSAPPSLRLPSLDFVCRRRAFDTAESALFACCYKLGLLDAGLRDTIRCLS